ncbi:hypothetical protein QAD02_020585 [Eretmocerus hayati]|uniref:Uncharacterized protein n=1 Tax=Eretmocerus hayati TaxID=131215 RepID=A0ACC2PR18_9HYME|nr:hypothetical protein QAD02_020585 [Eretmocerus hayati]
MIHRFVPTPDPVPATYNIIKVINTENSEVDTTNTCVSRVDDLNTVETVDFDAKEVVQAIDPANAENCNDPVKIIDDNDIIDGEKLTRTKHKPACLDNSVGDFDRLKRA